MNVHSHIRWCATRVHGPEADQRRQQPRRQQTTRSTTTAAQYVTTTYRRQPATTHFGDTTRHCLTSSTGYALATLPIFELAIVADSIEASRRLIHTGWPHWRFSCRRLRSAFLFISSFSYHFNYFESFSLC